MSSYVDLDLAEVTHEYHAALEALAKHAQEMGEAFAAGEYYRGFAIFNGPFKAQVARARYLKRVMSGQHG